MSSCRVRKQDTYVIEQVGFQQPGSLFWDTTKQCEKWNAVKYKQKRLKVAWNNLWIEQKIL